MAVFHINFCLPSRVDIFSSFVGICKSLSSMVFSKLTQVCNMIKSIYFVILQQTNTNKDKYYSTYLLRTINKYDGVLVIKTKSVDVVTIIKASFTKLISVVS